MSYTFKYKGSGEFAYAEMKIKMPVKFDYKNLPPVKKAYYIDRTGKKIVLWSKRKPRGKNI